MPPSLLASKTANITVKVGVYDLGGNLLGFQAETVPFDAMSRSSTELKRVLGKAEAAVMKRCGVGQYMTAVDDYWF